jgi:hypothetical protein
MVKRRSLLILAAVSLANLLLLWFFHDRYFYPTDDGFYAHIAERLLGGEVFVRDVQDIHPGYIHLVNVLAFRGFGIDFVSLRYPLVLVGLIQSCVVFLLLEKRGHAVATSGSLAATALGIPQFVDPNPNWYCLCLCFVLAGWLYWRPEERPSRLVGAGVLGGLLTLFRHLTGVWVAMAIFALALLEHSRRDRATGRDTWLARALVLTMLSGLVWYLVYSPETEPGGLLLMAAWPVGILLWLLVHVQAGNRSVLSIIGRVALGAGAAATPLALYLAVHGALTLWFQDIVLAALAELDLPFYGQGWYAVLPLAGVYQAVTSFDAVKLANGLYWTALPTLSAVNGAVVLTRMQRRESPHELILPVLASFFALTALLFEGPLYLYYTAGLSLVSVLWLITDRSAVRLVAGAVAASAIAIIAVVFHAGQSRERTPVEILQGRRVSSWGSETATLDRAHLRLSARDRDEYAGLVHTIQAQSTADESIFALPYDAELYFLAQRRNPFRFYSSAQGIKTREELDLVLSELRRQPPRLVIFSPTDKYNSDRSRAVMDQVRSTYVHIGTEYGREFYRAP